MSSASADPFKIEIEPQGNVAIVKLSGSANMDVSSDLKRQLFELVDSDCQRVVLDLSDLAFLSSVALGAVIAAHLRCRHHDCTLHLVSPQPPVRELLNITRLLGVFRVHDAMDEALSSD